MRTPHALFVAATASALALAGCATTPPNNATTRPPDVTTDDGIAQSALQQRACIDALKEHLQVLNVTRIDAFLAQTLNGLEVCDAGNGLAHLPTRDVSAWLNHADGKPHEVTTVPSQPAEITQLPKGPKARVRYQHDCITWMYRYLPANIARHGDDPDVAAADVFNGIEECDAVAGYATISRDDLAEWVKAKKLE